ncbi:MAG: hypothetical protein Kow0058_04400 [Roseovarius sp.]
MGEGQPRTLLGTIKDEGPYLLEWICYHRLIGFERIVIASNDCRDGSREMLDHLDAIGMITHVENSACQAGEPADPQNRAYARFWADDTIRASEWVLVADADEFLNIRVGDGTLDALIAAAEERAGGQVDLIAASWRVFGTGGIVDFRDAPVIAQFTRAARPGVHRIQRLTAFKTLFRPHVARRLGIHRPRLYPRFVEGKAQALWVNGAGAPMPARYLRQGWRMRADSYGDDLVSMNHYMIKSSEAFLMKRYRGTANSDDANRIDLSYFETFNVNDVEEHGIQRHLPALTQALARLRAEHPTLARLHEHSLGWHRQRLDSARRALLADDPAAARRLGLA